MASSLNTETDNSLLTHTHLGLNDKNVVATLMPVQDMEASINKTLLLKYKSSDKHDLICHQQADVFIEKLSLHLA
ncbi:hypothetical protein IFVP177_C1170411 [Vibrio parahaemolyticus]